MSPSRRPRPRLASRVESLESRRLLSVAPLRPDLLAASDTGVSDTDNITRFDNATPASALQFLVGNTTPGALVTLYVNKLPAGSATATQTSTPVSLDAAFVMPEGNHAVTARQTAPGDTESVDSDPLALTIDTTAPGVPPPPDLDAASDTGAANTDNLTNDNTPTFAVTGAPYYRLAQDGVVVVPLNNAATITVAPVTDGVHQFSISAVDLAGNESTSSPILDVTFDTVRPNASLASPLAVARRAETVYTFTVAYEDPRRIDAASIDAQDAQITLPNGTTAPVTLVSTTSVNDGTRQLATYRFVPPGGAWDYADNGEYLLRVRASQVLDVAGNFNNNAVTVGTLAVALLAPPATPDLIGADDTGISSTDNITRLDNGAPTRALRFLVRNTLSGATVTVYADGTPIGSAVARGPETTVTTNGSLAMPDSLYAITARQTIEGEPAVPASAALPLWIDSAPPPRPPAPDLRADSDSGIRDDDNLTNDNTPRFDVAVSLAPYYRLYRDGVKPPNVNDYATAISYTSSTLADGKYDFTLAAVDIAGNVSEMSTPLRVTVDTVAPAPPAFAGTPDPTFNVDGRYLVLNESPVFAAVQPDGKVLIGTTSPSRGTLQVRRLHADGGLDTTFGTAGTAFLPNSGAVRDVLFLDDGRIIIGSIRIFPDGRLDTSYGASGVAAYGIPVHTMVAAPGGKTVGIASVLRNGLSRFALSRLDANGAPDMTFGGTGVVETAVGPFGERGWNFASDVAVYGDGRILAVGTADGALSFSNERVVLVRYNPDGTLDNTFGTGGQVILGIGSRAEARSVSLRPDGGILISGKYSTSTDHEPTITFFARLLPDGTRDASYGTNGVRTITGFEPVPAILSDGHMLLLGRAFVSPDVSITKVDDALRTDPTLPGGVSTIATGSTLATMFAFSWVGPDDKVLLIGSVRQGEVWSTAVYRVHGRSFGVPDLQAASDSGASDADNITNDATPTIDVSASPTEPNVYFRLFRNGERVSGEYEPVGAYTAPAQPDGLWNYAVGFVDAAGNASANGPLLPVHIDTTAPQVTGAFVSGTTWSADFRIALRRAGIGELVGFKVPVQGDAAEALLPWVNADRVILLINEVVAFRKEDLLVQGIGGAYPAASLSTEFVNSSPAWTLARTLPRDRLVLTLADTIVDAAGNRLVAAPPPGGTPAPFQSRFNILPGDADRDGVVTVTDVAGTRARFNTAAPVGAPLGTSSRAYHPLYDFNGDGRITTPDFTVPRRLIGSRLPPPPAPLASAPPPTRNALLARRSALLGESTATPVLPA